MREFNKIVSLKGSSMVVGMGKFSGRTSVRLEQVWERRKGKGEKGQNEHVVQSSKYQRVC